MTEPINPRHFIKVLTVNFVPWAEGGTYVFRYTCDDLFLCVDEAVAAFEGRPGDGDPYFPDECLKHLSVGSKRVFHVYKPILAQRPALSNYATDMLECYLLQHGKVVAGLNLDELSEYDLYPALDRFLRGTCGIQVGEHFNVWMSGDPSGSDQTTEGDE